MIADIQTKANNQRFFYLDYYENIQEQQRYSDVLYYIWIGLRL